MKVLDCESINSTYKSLEEITSISMDRINDFLLEYDKKLLETPNSEKIILNSFKKEYKTQLNFENVCYFHFTRIPKFDLNKGLLPSKESVDIIWDYLLSLVEKDEKNLLKEHRKYLEDGKIENNDGRRYTEKVNNNEFNDGPCAFLIKDCGKCTSNRDYLRNAPEIVEDICKSFDDIFKIGLLKRYLDNTKPCIIKFKTKDYNSELIGPALLYLYYIKHDQKLSLDCNYTSNAYGVKIPPNDILKIECGEYLIKKS